jgi:hypothetical protein
MEVTFYLIAVVIVIIVILAARGVCTAHAVIIVIGVARVIIFVFFRGVVAVFCFTVVSAVLVRALIVVFVVVEMVPEVDVDASIVIVSVACWRCHSCDGRVKREKVGIGGSGSFSKPLWEERCLHSSKREISCQGHSWERPGWLGMVLLQ